MDTIPKLIENKKTIGLIKGFWIEDILRKNYPSLKIKEFPSAFLALEALSKKEIDAYIDSAVAISYQVNRHILSGIKISNAIVIDGKPYQKFHLGIRKDWELFQGIIEKAINNIKEEDILNLQRKWFGNVLEGNVSKQMLLSVAEKEFLKKNKTVKFGIDTSWPPFEYVDSNNEYQGVVKDISEYLLKENLGLNLDIKKEQSWFNHIDKITEKRIDVIGGISYSTQRLKNMIFSDPYLKIPLVVVGRNNEILIDSINDLNGKKLGVVKGYITEHIIKTKYPNIEIKLYNNIEDSLYDLSRGVIHYVFDSLPTINYVIQQEGITNLKLLIKTNESVELSFGVRKDWPELVIAINKMIKAMPKERKSTIVNKWLKLNIEKKIDYELIWKIVLGFIFIVIIIIYWNRKLASEIKQRKIIEKELKESQIKAELANKAKSEFLSNMSHEIRTPMNAVIGFAELTSKMDLPSKALKNIDIIQKSSKALVTIINDILDLSKIEAGKLDINKQATNIVNLAEELNAIFAVKAEQKGLFFDISFADNCSSILLVDEVRIRQILINLIGNAIKFTDHGQILVSFESKPNIKNDDTIDLIIKVEDTGIGIDENDREKVFGMFEQQSSQDNRLYGGTGLGLSISNKLALLMNGNITLESEKGKGSKFYLKLEHIEIASTAPSISKSISSIEFEKSLVLVVDDIQNNIDLLDNILKSYGFSVIFARNGQEAVDISEKKQPSIILMDLKMPVLDGFEASKIIKDNPNTSHIPIIAISASVLGSKDTSPKNNAFDEFLPKPIDIMDLEESLSKFLKHKKSKILSNNEISSKTNLILNTIKNKDNILSLAKNAYNNGDLQSAEKLIEFLKEENIEKSFILSLESDIESLDIENIENKMKLIINGLE